MLLTSYPRRVPALQGVLRKSHGDGMLSFDVDEPRSRSRSGSPAMPRARSRSHSPPTAFRPPKSDIETLERRASEVATGRRDWRVHSEESGLEDTKRARTASSPAASRRNASPHRRRGSASGTPIPEHSQRDPTPRSFREQLAEDVFREVSSQGYPEGTPVPEDNIWERIIDKTRVSMSPRPPKLSARSRSASAFSTKAVNGGGLRSPAINAARVSKSPASYSHGQLVYAPPRGMHPNGSKAASRGATPVSSARDEVNESLNLQKDLRARVAQLEVREKASNERIRTLESLVLALAQSAPGFQLEYIGSNGKQAPGGAQGGGGGGAREMLPRAMSSSPSKASETWSIDRGVQGQVVFHRRSDTSGGALSPLTDQYPPAHNNHQPGIGRFPPPVETDTGDEDSEYGAGGASRGEGGGGGGGGEGKLRPPPMDRVGSETGESEVSSRVVEMRASKLRQISQLRPAARSWLPQVD